ncbi:MAG: PEP-CTERM sorting domain-containing protein [Thermoguttaceae bacterium]|nr:PEP-CTERM sorting domain-containing protein [Thermoguttaceae bacterium]
MTKRTFLFAAIFAALILPSLFAQADETFDGSAIYWIGGADNNFYTGSLNSGTTSNWQDADGTLCKTRYINGDTAAAQYTQNCYIYNTPNTVKMDWGDMGVASVTLGDGTGEHTATMERRDGSNNYTYLDVKTILTVQTGGSLTTGSLTITNRNNTNGTVTVSGGSLTSNSSIAVTNGTLNLTGGTLKANSITIGSNGTFTHSGGTLTTNGNGLSITGDYTLGAGATLKPDGQIGVSGTAALNGTMDLSVYAAKTNVPDGGYFTLVTAGSITMPDAKKIAIGNALPARWVVTLSSTNLRATYDNGSGKFYWTGSAGDNNMFTAGNWVYGTESSTDKVLGQYIGATSHNVSDFIRNCYVYSTSSDVKIDWSDLGMASLTVGDGTGTRTAAMYSQRGPQGFDIRTTLTVNKGGTVTMTSNTPTNVTGTLNVNGGTYNSDAAIKIYDGGELNFTSGTINVGAGGITNTSGAYAINLGGGTIGTNGADWSTSLDATLVDSSITTFAPDADRTIIWNGAFVNESQNAQIVKDGAGTLKINSSTQSNPTKLQSITVKTGELDYKGYLTGNLTVQNGAVMSPGNSIGTADITGTFTLEPGATLLVELAGSESDLLQATSFDVASGTIDLEVGSIQRGRSYLILQKTQGSFEGDYLTDEFWNDLLAPADQYIWNLAVVGNNKVYATIDSNAVPEPSTWLLLVLGTAGLFYWRKKK